MSECAHDFFTSQITVKLPKSHTSSALMRLIGRISTQGKLNVYNARLQKSHHSTPSLKTDPAEVRRIQHGA